MLDFKKFIYFCMSEHMNMMNLKIDHSSPLPLHAQVEQLLRELINDPKYQQGAFLPKEVDLAKLLGVSRNTIRQATNKLEYEGLLVRKKGVGTKVAEQTVSTQLDSWHSFTQEMTEQGIQLKNYEISCKYLPASANVAEFMGIQEGTEVVCLVRLRGNEEVPFVYFESYFHPRIGLTADEDFSIPLYDLLEKKYSTIANISRERLSARLASVITAERLKIKAGEPVLKRERRVFDPGNRPIEYNVGFYRADKFSYTIDIKR
jgi:GntR family transcriptional regulator